MSFYYQDMDVYYIALGFVDTVLDILKGYGSVLNNLMRRLETSAVNIPLTFARVAGEGNRRISREGIFEVRGKVFECQSLLELLWRRKLIQDKHSEELGETLIVLDNMLSDLVASANTTRSQRVYRPPG